MSTRIDYSKWDLIDEDGDDDDRENVEPSLMSNDKLGGLKLEADKLFAAAECSQDPYDYKVALNHGYGIVFTALDKLSQNQENVTDVLRHFEISCKLNASCCHLKLTQYDGTIQICSKLLIENLALMSPDQILRLRYFRSYAYFKLGSEDGLLRAESDTICMKSILSSLPTIHGPSATEYMKYFQTLNQEMNKLNLIDQKILSESEFHKFQQKDSMHSKEGWRLYVQGDFSLSSIWFAKELKDMKKKCQDIPPSDSSLLCDLYSGYGKSQSALSNHVEAAKSFLAAASHSTSSMTKRSLHLRAAALCFKSGEYERSISSYTTVLDLLEDCTESTVTAIELDSSVSSSQSNGFQNNQSLIIAVAKAGLGMCYVKTKEFSQAVDHLKDAVGFLTSDLFNRRAVTTQRKLPFMLIPGKEIKTETLSNAECSEGSHAERGWTLPSVTTQVYHLLNALESLSDAYAAMREWEKALYTSNSIIEVCEEFLTVIQPVASPTQGILAGIPDDPEGTGGPGSLSAGDQDDESSPLVAQKTKKVIVHSVTLKDEVGAALRGDNGSLEGGDSDDAAMEKVKCVTVLCRTKATALLAKGHMMKKVLYHDINRSNSHGDGDNNEAGYIFGAMDSNLSTVPLTDTCKSSSNCDSCSSVSAVDEISSLWSSSAAEFESLGDFEKAFCVYKDMAAVWGDVADVRPYSDSLFLLREQSERTFPDECSSQELTSTLSPSSSHLSSSLSPTLPDYMSTQHGIEVPSNAPAKLQYCLPLECDSEDSSHRIEAAKRAKDAWIIAADVATKLCKLNFANNGRADSSSKKEESRTNVMDSSDSSKDVERLELELTGWLKVIQCEYNAGLCALLVDMGCAEGLFERAQQTKRTYQDLCGALAQAEKRYVSDNIMSDIEGMDDVSKELIFSAAAKEAESNARRKEVKKQSWQFYITLCCDISYHLGYTYLRSDRVAYAIAEAEMAIGFAMSSSNSKIRRRKCWGILALGFHESGQGVETERALKEVRNLKPGLKGVPEDDDDVVQLQAFMSHSVSSRRTPVLAPVRVAEMYGTKDPGSLAMPSSKPPAAPAIVSSVLDKNKDRQLYCFFYIIAASILFLIISIVLAFKY